MTVIEARKTRVRRGQLVGQKWRIVTRQFGYPIYAASLPLAELPWSDLIEESYVYDARDVRETKLTWWKALAKVHGLDPACVQIEEDV